MVTYTAPIDAIRILREETFKSVPALFLQGLCLRFVVSSALVSYQILRVAKDNSNYCLGVSRTSLITTGRGVFSIWYDSFLLDGQELLGEALSLQVL